MTFEIGYGGDRSVDPLHQHVGEIGEGISQGGKLPVEHRGDTRLGRVHHHVIQPVVGMDDGRLIVGGNRLGQPFDQAFDGLDALGFGSLVLLGPAIDLAGHVVARPAKTLEAYGEVVGVVEIGEGPQRRHVDGVTFGRSVGRQRLIPQHPSLDHVHDVEHRSDHRLVGAQAKGPRDRETRRIESRDHPELAVDGVSRGQELSRRFAPHDVGFRRRDQLVSRIGLAALELTHLHRAGKALDVGGHPFRQRPLVEPVALGDQLGAGVQRFSLPLGGGYLIGHVAPRGPLGTRHSIEGAAGAPSGRRSGSRQTARQPMSVR